MSAISRAITEENERVSQASQFRPQFPEKGFQMVRYYGWYSNKSMGQRRKERMLRPGDNPPEKKDSEDFTVLDISDYELPRASSRTWRELIKKVWEVDPLTCPQCGSEMRIISLIQDPDVIRRWPGYEEPTITFH
jgi:hypothetical protein